MGDILLFSVLRLNKVYSAGLSGTNRHFKRSDSFNNKFKKKRP